MVISQSYIYHLPAANVASVRFGRFRISERPRRERQVIDIGLRLTGQVLMPESRNLPQEAMSIQRIQLWRLLLTGEGGGKSDVSRSDVHLTFAQDNVSSMPKEYRRVNGQPYSSSGLCTEALESNLPMLRTQGDSFHVTTVT